MPNLRQATVVAAFVAALCYARWQEHLGSRPTPAAGAFGLRFEEVAEDIGIRFTHQKVQVDPKLAPIEPHVSGVGAATAIGDVDGDGWSDVLMTTSAFGAPSALFRNRRDGTFEDVAAAWGIDQLNSRDRGATMGALFSDVDNDGDEDLLVYKWGYPQLFLNDAHRRFVDATMDSGLGRWINSNSAAFLDYDRDGLLDLYVGGYFREEHVLWDLKSTRIMQSSFEFAENAGHNVLYRNLGGGKFEDVTARAGVDSTRWTFAIAAADFDGNGFQDLYLANDYGPEELFLNQDGARFTRASDIGLDEDSKSGMSVAVGDIDNCGKLGVFVTNITRTGYLIQGNNLRKNMLGEDGRFENIASGVAENCGWAWGAQFGDLNNDGWQDLFVVNGFISADPKLDYWYAMGKVSSAVGDLFEDATAWPEIGNRSLSGYEVSRVLINTPLHKSGRRTFTDVASQTGVTDTLDGRAVAFTDLGNRGQLDVVVANQSARALVYRSELAPGAHWIQFGLRGTRSNRSAIGAAVELEFGGHRQVQVIAAGSGFASQNDRRLHFGLGDAARVERARIRWPSGHEQVIENPALDQLHVVTESTP
ncbi:MAG: CRTAC1 family protein [Planctomycetes bacterium]|nr:CRTAC1 family protein [Planctomycetota bacterium]MCC7169292.1 CRTAC1 family protein [Planctomycetota bacterium]